MYALRVPTHVGGISTHSNIIHVYPQQNIKIDETITAADLLQVCIIHSCNYLVVLVQDSKNRKEKKKAAGGWVVPIWVWSLFEVLGTVLNIYPFISLSYMKVVYWHHDNGQFVQFVIFDILEAICRNLAGNYPQSPGLSLARAFPQPWSFLSPARYLHVCLFISIVVARSVQVSQFKKSLLNITDHTPSLPLVKEEVP